MLSKLVSRCSASLKSRNRRCPLISAAAVSVQQQHLFSCDAEAARTSSSASSSVKPRKRILITGANGNLGTKLMQFWQNKHEMILVDVEKPNAMINQCLRTAKLQHNFIKLDVQHSKNTLTQITSSVDTVIHFAAARPHPDADWNECISCMDMNNNVLLNCAVNAHKQNRKMRIIFASSNHMMGGYLHEGSSVSQCLERQKERAADAQHYPHLHSDHDHNQDHIYTHSIEFTAKTSPKPGTVFELPSGFRCDSTKYAVAKLHGERLLSQLCADYGPAVLEGIVARIGWCQPGQNLPSTLNPEGKSVSSKFDVDVYEGEDEDENDMYRQHEADIKLWFENMWLSNIDLLRLFETAVMFDMTTATQKDNVNEDGTQNFYIVNGVSNNSDSRWSVVNEIGYTPLLNVHEWTPEMEERIQNQKESKQLKL